MNLNFFKIPHTYFMFIKAKCEAIYVDKVPSLK